MEVMYPRCAGLDVHKETVVACVRLAAGSEASRLVRTFATTTAGLIELGEWLEENGCTHVAMEATGVYWKPVWQVLADSSFELILANAAQVKNVPGRKTDVNDATWLSELLAHGLVRASFVPQPAIQELRGLLRTRKQLVREKASHVQRVRPPSQASRYSRRHGLIPDRGAAAPQCTERHIVRTAGSVCRRTSEIGKRARKKSYRCSGRRRVQRPASWRSRRGPNRERRPCFLGGTQH
jgi:transposase